MADPTRPTDTEGGVLPSNLIVNEAHTVTSVNSRPWRILVPLFTPFYLRDVKLEHVDDQGVVTELHEGPDYYPCFRYMDADRKTSYPVYAGFEIVDERLTGYFRVTYRCLGDDWVPDREYIFGKLQELIYNRRTVWWDQITNVQQLFPVTDHPTPAEEISGYQEILRKMDDIALAVLQAGGQFPASTIAHTLVKGNAHDMTASDINLGNVKNYPVATDAEVVNQTVTVGPDGKIVEKYITLRQALQLLGR